MNMTEKQKKVLLYSLGAYTIGGFLFAVGVMLETTVALITFYFIGIAMVIAGILALYNNYKLEKQTKLYLYLSFIGLLLFILFTILLITQITGV
ncbi:MAG: hypothetical protein ACK5LC_13115 [Coprobacillaceae bacterium]